MPLVNLIWSTWSWSPSIGGEVETNVMKSTTDFLTFEPVILAYAPLHIVNADQNDPFFSVMECCNQVFMEDGSACVFIGLDSCYSLLIF